ncbi:Uncharacterized protein HZ326_13621 [Fusarium oxysporum f. sp. albedinis]|nr:Uncharacterized protein HZ326_13621 [Fusarium oxysporum f. sp. albedinis]
MSRLDWEETPENLPDLPSELGRELFVPLAFENSQKAFCGYNTRPSRSRTEAMVLYLSVCHTAPWFYMGFNEAIKDQIGNCSLLGDINISNI